MKSNTKLFSFFLFFILSVSLTACNKTNGNTTEASIITQNTQIQAEFENFLSKEFEESLKEDALSTHYLLNNPNAYGIELSELSLGEFSLKQFQKDAEQNKQSLDKLLALSRDSLSEEQQLTYDVLKDYLEKLNGFSGLEYYNNILGTTNGVPTNLPTNFTEYYFGDEKDIVEYLKLLTQVDDYLDQVIAFVKEQADAGFGLPDDCLQETMNQCKTFISPKLKEHSFVETFNDKVEPLTGIDEQKKQAYKKENLQIVKDEIIPCYENLINVLQSLKGKAKNEKGLCNYKDGKEYYEKYVAFLTGSDKSIDEIYKKLQKELNSCILYMSKAYMQDNKIFDKLIDVDYGCSEPTETLDLLQVLIQDDYPEIPKVPYTVSYLQESLENNSTVAYYLSPQIDNSMNNIIRVNGSITKDSDTPLFTTLAHEGYPGHLYQTNYFYATNPNPIRYLISCLGYQEGWASYVESQSNAFANLNDDLLVEVLQNNSKSNLYLSCVMDIGIHYYGWDKSKLKEFLSDYGLDDDATVDMLYTSILSDPAIMLSYGVGLLEMEELRNYAMEKLGDEFVLKDFHKAILDVGTAPFYIVKQELDKYIAASLY